MTKRTRRVVIEKDTFRKGYYAIYDCGYSGGKLSSKTLVDFCKRKRDAELIKKHYLAGKTPDIVGHFLTPVRGQ